MRKRVGRSRGQAILLTAGLLTVASGAALTGNGVAAARTLSPAAISRAAASAGVNTITVTSPGGQATAPGTPVSLQIQATDSDATQTLTFTAGSPATLPPDLAISASGLITGTPTAADIGTYSVTITATDTTGSTGTATFTWTIANTVTVTAPSAETVAPNEPITPVTVTASDSDQAQTSFTYTPSTLPAGLTMSAGGVITGTPAAADVAASPITSTITVTDSTGATGTAIIAWTVAYNTITVTTLPSQSTPPNTAVSLQVQAADSDTTQTTFGYSASGLPPGLTIDPTTGLISGTTQSTVGTYSVKVTVTNATSTPASVTFPWSVAWNQITVTAPRTEQSRVGVAIAPVQITAQDATPGQTLTYTAVNLPQGLAINYTTGVISGTPLKLSNVTATVTVSDTTGSSGTAVITWKVGAVIVIPSPGKQVIFLGQPVNIPLTVADNVRSDSVTLRVSGMPRGVSFRHRPPLLSGWPRSRGTHHIVVTARGKDGGVAVRRFSIVIRPARNAGPRGAIRLDIAHKCLNDPRNRSANGTRVNIWSCDHKATQRWTMAEDGTIRIHGKCLTVVRGKLRLERCTASHTQTWVKGTRAELVSPALHRCLADPGARRRNGVHPVLAKCTGGRAERWTAPSGPLLAGLMDKCADDHYSSTANGNVIDVFTCNGSAAQNWQVRPDKTIRTFGRCLTVKGRAGRAGAKIELWACHAGNARQHWRIITHGTFVAQIKNGGACLAVPGYTSPDGTQLRLERCPATGRASAWHDW